MNKISKNMKITQRIMIPIAILFIALILVGTLSIVQIVSLSKLSDEVSVVSDILRMRNDHLSWVMKLRDSIDTNEEFTGGPDPTQCRMGKWMYLDETQSHPDPDVQSYLAEIEPYHNLLHEAVPIVNALVADQETEQLRQYYYDTIDPTLGSIMTILTKLDVKFSEIGTAAHDKLKSTEQSSIVLLAVAVSVGLVISAIMAVYVIVNLNKILNNLTAELSSSSKSVSSASVQLASAGQQLSEGSTEQAASIEETSATMDQTSSMVKQNAENTRQANNLSKEASEAAAIGSSKMKDMTSSMEELKKSSSDISKIIKVIDDIAFQTNMLALNAAVEAARAGEAGQGFAVVAEEVRNLAHKSAQAAKDTAEIIDRNIELSDTGVSISADVSTALQEIMLKSQNVNQLMGEISAASDEQSKGTQQVTEAISQMEVVVQSTAATAEESAASAEELQSQAKALEKVVYSLNKLVNGAKKQIKKTKNTKQIEQRKPTAIASAPHKTTTKQQKHIMTPDDVIPLDDDNDF